MSGCARKSAAKPALRGLDWLNFFLADVQTGVGPFLAIYLAKCGWNEQLVGIALAVGALLIAILPRLWPIMIAQLLIGASSSIFIPAICAISLGIVGHRLFDRRQGRNQTFNSAALTMTWRAGPKLWALKTV